MNDPKPSDALSRNSARGPPKIACGRRRVRGRRSRPRSSKRPPRRAPPTAAWKSLRDSHSAHRPCWISLRNRNQKPERTTGSGEKEWPPIKRKPLAPFGRELTWFPFSLPQRWPFCWWVGVVVDQISRRLIAFEVYLQLPSSDRIQTLLNRAIREQGVPPRCIVSDKGVQFKCRSYRRWCKRRGIRVMFGYLGEPCSIPIVERFIRSMKEECFRPIVLPATRSGMLRELGHFSIWYNEHRPHSHHDGRTPREVWCRRTARRPRIEPRPRWPHRSKGCVSGRRLALEVSYVSGRKHLPVIELHRAA